MKKKKIISIIISLLLLVIAFCGCANNKKNNNPCEASFINQQMKDMLHGIERVDDAGFLYKMEYTYNYYDSSITEILKNMGPIDTGCSAYQLFCWV